MAVDNGLEVEVKFLLKDLTAVRERIIHAGARLTKPRVHERNVRFDTADNALLARWELLRLREDTAVTLTFKRPSAADATSEAKVREETEVHVDDARSMALILEHLGFQPQQMYEKYRETFHLDGVDLVLDELPYGTFLELEGGEEKIRSMAARLNLDWGQRILANYLGIMALLQEHANLPFRDVSFANFENSSVSAWDIFPLLSRQITEEVRDHDAK